MTRALIVEQTTQRGLHTRVANFDPANLDPGNVTVAVEWSAVNYKDAAAVIGKFPIISRFPMIAGCDFAGVVQSSEDPRYRPGDRVVANGWGLSQTHHGGYAQIARIPAEWLIPLPETLSTRQAMAIGTAGYTAMLCVLALEAHGFDKTGSVLVTGASGGVGSIAVTLLAGLGLQVVASTGSIEATAYLMALGASSVIDRAVLSVPGEPLQAERWAAVVDTVGSVTLANALSQTAYGGVVTACGLAQGADLPASVLPMIVRNVALLGVDSVHALRGLRVEAWNRLARDLDSGKLETMVTEIGLGDIVTAANDVLAGRVQGRVLVDVSR